MRMLFTRKSVQLWGTILLAAATLSFVSCSASKKASEEKLPQLGDVATDDMSAESFQGNGIITPSSTAPIYNIQRDGISFDVGLNDSNRVCFIATSDSTFTTDEGLRVGSTYRDVKLVSDSTLHTEPGWGYYVGLPSGWRVFFGVGPTMTEAEPVDTTRVVFFFKRD